MTENSTKNIDRSIDCTSQTTFCGISCDTILNNTPALVVALDFKTKEEAFLLAKKIQGLAPWVKVGLELFVSEGPQIVQTFKEMGFNVFLDLKLYDIPNTVKGAVSSAIESKADLLTLHLSGGKRMCKAALEAVESAKNIGKSSIALFGVSVLTSFEEGELVGYEKPLSSMVETLVKGAQEWGMHGIVCSGHEVAAMKKMAPSLKFLTPGIRLDDKKSDDQRRVMTPYQAVLDGADFLVVGRPITQAKDPKAICQTILQDILKAVENANANRQGDVL